MWGPDMDSDPYLMDTDPQPCCIKSNTDRQLAMSYVKEYLPPFQSRTKHASYSGRKILYDSTKPRTSKKKIKKCCQFFLFFSIFCQFFALLSKFFGKRKHFLILTEKNWVLEEFLKFQQAIFKRRKTNFRDNVHC